MASATETPRLGNVPAAGRPGDRRRYVDAAAALLLFVFTAVSQWGLLRGGTVLGVDSATQFYPWYSYLGESLRSGEVPGWNPHLFSGAPFAADPLSGWTYLPAMLLFTVLPLAAAAKVYLFVHPLLAGLFVYGLARTLRLDTAGALVAAMAYEFSGYLYVRNTCCFAYASVATWLPLTILGAELAIRGRRWTDRGLWWGVSGLGLSQILASWLGQGSYYALLALGGYVAYRTLIDPPDNFRGVRARFVGLCLHGGAVLLFGFGLAAAGILPRLEYNALSGLAGGYSQPAGGWSAVDWNRLFVSFDVSYAGVAVLALAIAAPLVVRGRFAVPYFAALSLSALVLSGEGTTPLHSALYLLPRFEELHQHYPQRAMAVFYLGAALLAGATLTGLGRPGRKAPLLAAPPVLAALFLVILGNRIDPSETSVGTVASGPWEVPAPFLIETGVVLLPGPFFALILILAGTTARALLPARLAAWRGVACALVVLAVFVDLFAAGTVAIEARADLGRTDRTPKQDLGAYYAPTDATRFLRSGGGEPSRYVGYSPLAHYNGGFANPDKRALEAENRAILRDGLYNVQGYNAVHLARYDAYVEAMNGRSQDYHGANVYAGGLDSPLLDLLNVRHIVVPAKPPRGGATKGLERLEREHTTVYEDDRVKILENENALPRTWIVHSARRTKPEKALALLASGAVDPRETALLEERPPNLAEPDDPSEDRSSVARYGANAVEIETSTGARGLLVLSEVYYPAWKAYVDGEPVPLYRADHLLRAVPLPAGEHTVELRYESWTLTLGVAVSLVTGLALAALVFVRIRRPLAVRTPPKQPRRKAP